MDYPWKPFADHFRKLDAECQRPASGLGRALQMALILILASPSLAIIGWALAGLLTTRAGVLIVTVPPLVVWLIHRWKTA